MYAVFFGLIVVLMSVAYAHDKDPDNYKVDFFDRTDKIANRANMFSALILVISILLIRSLLKSRAKSAVSTRDKLMCAHTVIFLATIVCNTIQIPMIEMEGKGAVRACKQIIVYESMSLSISILYIFIILLLVYMTHRIILTPQ